MVKKNEGHKFNDNKLTNLDSFTINRKANLDEDVSNKKYIDDELNKKIILRFNQTLGNYLKVPNGNDIYNLAKYDKRPITDTAKIIAPNNGGYLLQRWIMKCNDKWFWKNAENYKINKNKLNHSKFRSYEFA